MARPHSSGRTATLAFMVLSAPLAATQSCISLSGSTQCSAFNGSSISTGPEVSSLFPFVSFVSSREQFDQRLSEYVNTTYVQQKFQQLLGCSDVSLTNTTSYYARYTTSVICNAIVQNSITPCVLSRDQAPPLCADSCAQQAISEEQIVANGELCGTPGQDFISQIRADFTNCALPADSLSGRCVTGEENEPNDCGYATNLDGLCRFCGASSPNATDSCCVASNVTSRCEGVTLPTLTSIPSLFPTATASPTSTAAAAETGSGSGLSGGAIAGIVIGSVAGAALLLGLLILLSFCLRRRRGSQKGSVFNQASPKRSPQMGMAAAPREMQPVPGGRVARMTALEGSSSDEKSRPNPVLAAERQRFEMSDSDQYGESPESNGATRPVTGRRQGSLSSNSVFGALGDETSPSNQLSSPEGVQSGQSEQLSAFKDYYSQDDIHPGDRVAVLWAYQPRAGDEFELERGDMLKVVGIWDDGWATGVRISDRAEDFDPKHKKQRDSGVSNGSGRRSPSPSPMGEVKAFPLVCVCLPEHWKKTIEGDSSTDTTSGGGGHPPGLVNF